MGLMHNTEKMEESLKRRLFAIGAIIATLAIILSLAGCSVQGAAGPKGSTGAQGPQGATGAQGPQGETGLQGPKGLITTGVTGEKGAKGDTGVAGPQGVKGDTGVQGPGGSGPQGATGAVGATGATGATGAAGPQGIAGPVGPAGPAGLSGYELIISPVMQFAAGGWAGWSAPAGKVVLGGGVFGVHARISSPAFPNSVWPHYTYGPNEFGWVVQAAEAGNGWIVVICATVTNPIITDLRPK